MTKRARGEARRLLVVIGELQGMIGEAIGQHYNDRSPSSFEKGQRLLEKAFKICIQATSDYDPVDVE